MLFVQPLHPVVLHCTINQSKIKIQQTEIISAICCLMTPVQALRRRTADTWDNVISKETIGMTAYEISADLVYKAVNGASGQLLTLIG